MRRKQLELVKFLMDKSSNATILADHLNVSVRTIKNYVKAINEAYPKTIKSSNIGYQIDQEKALKILNKTNHQIPQSSNDRVDFIVNRLLNTNKDALTNIYDLSDDLYISISTLRNDLDKVKRIIKKYSLRLVQDGEWISIQGLEKDKRKLLSAILYEESSVNFVNLESLQNSFKDINIDFVRTVILSTLDDHHYFINDYSLINLILHVTIAIDRIQNQNVDVDLNNLPEFIKINEYPVAKEIALKLSREFNVKFDTFEINELSLLIASRASSLDYKSISKTNIEEYIGKELLDIVNHLIDSINAFFHMKLFDDDFLVRFALHIRSLLIRSKNNQLSKNPLSENIRRTSPLIYESSVNLASDLKDLTGISINDDEIAYIAFHIGSSIEAIESLKEKVKAAYYCPNYHNIQDSIVNFVKQYFEKDIMITTIITDESQIPDLENIDFILTSIPIATPTLLPVIQVGIFPNDHDRLLLSEFINRTRRLKEQKKFERYLRMLLTEKTFEVVTSVDNHIECIKYMANNLIDLDFVHPNFLDDVLERERLSSTAFAGAAIPHSMYMNAKKTAISILINPNGIKWDDTNVNLVIMMSFKKSERYIFNEIFEPITMILTDIENLHMLTAVDNYEDFIKMIVSFL